MLKYVILIADGCADFAQQALGGKTPLQAADKENLDDLARKGTVGRARTIPEGIAPGSDTAILGIFGYDPRTYYTGRSPLEAAGSGVSLRPGNVSYRLNLASVEGEGALGEGIMRSHSGGNIEGEQALGLMAAMLADEKISALMRDIGMTVQVSPTFRHVAVQESSSGEMQTTPPHEILDQPVAAYLPTGAGRIRELMERSYEVLRDHPINRERIAAGKQPANCAWLWGQGSAIELPDFTAKYGKTAAVITAVPLVRGIANLAGVRVVDVPTATGDIHTDYEAKARAAVQALKDGADAVVVHVEAPDECSHEGSLAGKMEAVHRIDSRLLPLLRDGIEAMGADWRLLTLSDHYTLLSTRGHDATPVPYLLYDSRTDTGAGLPFDEVSAEQGPYVEPATRLIAQLFEMEHS